MEEKIIKFYIITIMSKGNTISKSGKLTTSKDKNAKSNFEAIQKDIIKEYDIKEHAVIFYHIEDYNSEESKK